MSSRDDVIQWLIDNCIIEKFANRYKHYLTNDWDDFVQEMWEIILKLPNDKLIRLYDNSELLNYIYKIAKNQLFNKKSKFSKTYERFIIKNSLDTNEISEERDQFLSDKITENEERYNK